MIQKTIIGLGLLAVGGFLLGGCESSIVSLKPLQRVEMWVPDDGTPAIQLSPPVDVPAASPAVARVDDEQDGDLGPATEPTTQSAAATQSTTLPAEVKPVDIGKNQASTLPARTQVAASQVAASQEAGTQVAGTQAAATEPAGSQPATSPAAASTQALPPGKKVIKIIDPNETSRFIYKASYDNVWQQALQLVSRTGFTLDRQDYRLGVITTQPLPSAQVVEFWKPQQTTFTNAAENTINSQRRLLRLTISPVPGKPEFYQIGVRVLVERETNPTEMVGGPIFVEGSGFGRNTMTLRSDFAEVKQQPMKWIVLGHDPKLEKKILDQLFLRI